ncbi:hypothetical protein BJ546DRAFT_1078522 [Cryomyces antarcticus]|uniref:Fungal-type protein kinase domain-containing protein n=1 Tax=Cryomyces antarcticus TaxID=329879 RepID=A0ABR0LXL8_9PEZI|nr:hypothetical protein LTR39_002251 [Cryomyces antarcticus]KAK5016861.1 hypothetical protein LTR60_002199 [Cryomyces antarcticus]KAK5256014.1 hypothetical protein LTR16_004202 [Cryomyces antarcticus]
MPTPTSSIGSRWSQDFELTEEDWAQGSALARKFLVIYQRICETRYQNDFMPWDEISYAFGCLVLNIRVYTHSSQLVGKPEQALTGTDALVLLFDQAFKKIRNPDHRFGHVHATILLLLGLGFRIRTGRKPKDIRRWMKRVNGGGSVKAQMFGSSAQEQDEISDLITASLREDDMEFRNLDAGELYSQVQQTGNRFEQKDRRVQVNTLAAASPPESRRLSMFSFFDD